MKSATKINLIWAIGVLVAANAGLLLRLTDGQAVTSYISFAASVASLILAVVAIFYSMMSNQGFAGTLETLKEASKRIEEGALSVANISDEFVSKSELLLTGISAVPSSVEKMAEGLSSRLDNLVGDSRVRTAQVKGDTDVSFLDRATVGLSIAFYVTALSYKHKKSFDVDDVYKAKTVADYVSGSIAALAVAKFKDLDVSYVRRSFQVISPGNIDVDKVIERVKRSNHKTTKDCIKIADKFFDHKSSELLFDDEGEENEVTENEDTED